MQPELCAQGTTNASPVTPTVWLVIDGSGSMKESFGGSTRWVSLRAALMDMGGVVPDLERVVRFGMVIYNGPDTQGQSQCNAPDKVNLLCGCLTGSEAACCEAACGGTPPPPPADPTMCANLVVIDPALNNFATLDAAYPAKEIGGWTPTDRALEHVVKNLPVLNMQQGPDTQADPVYVILATDGQPNDHCTDNGGGGSDFQPEVAQRVLDAVNSGVQMGMSMFVISLAGNDAQLRMHLEQVAAAGNTGKPPFEPSSKDALAAVLREVVGGASCQIALDGEVQMGQECAGEVTLNGNPLECGSDNGWRMADPRTVQITGSACDMFLATASQVHAAFPCGVFIPD